MIKEILDGYARSPAMNSAFLMDRMRTVGASEIGQCARRMYYVKTENRTDHDYHDGWGARVRGKIIEQAFWLPAMRRRFRKKLLIAGKDQTTFQDRYLSATPDGLLIEQPRDCLAHLGIPDIGPSQCLLVECKSIDPRANLTEAKNEHQMQTNTQLGLVRLQSRYRPDYALISYTDASFWDDVDEFVVKFDAAAYEKAHARAVKIKTASSASELKPEGWIAGGKECEHCPFNGPCGIARRSLPPEGGVAEPQFQAELTDLCIEHEKLNKQAKELDARLNEKKNEIKDRLRAKGVRKIDGVVTWYPVKGRDKIDTAAYNAAAFAAGVDVSEYTTTGDPTDGLRVTIKGAPVA